MGSSKTGRNTSQERPSRYCYVVECNKEPIIYATYGSRKKAVRYAKSLVKYRNPKAYKHCYCATAQDIERATAAQQGWGDVLVYSVCLESDDPEVDGCFVRVRRYPLR